MGITQAKQGDVEVIRIQGELVSETAGDFRALLEESLRNDEHNYVVDCSETLRIDSAGLEMLTWLQRTCVQRLGRVKLAGLNSGLRVILRITRLDTHFEQYDDAQKAVESFG